MRRAALLGGLLLSLIVAPAASGAQNDTLLVSRADGPTGAGADGSSFAPSISADGDLVAFDSTATNLRLEASGEASNVFVRSLSKNTLVLASRADGPSGAAGNSSSFSPTISADGRYVAFLSYATNLAAGDTDPQNETSDIFVRDLQTDTTVLVSRASGPAGAKGDLDSYGQAISADGRYVTFVSTASNLTPDDPDGLEDVFVRDLKTNTTTLVSHPVLDMPKNEGQTNSPSISADGRFIAFLSARDDLSAQSTPVEFSADILVKDMQTQKIELVSRADGPVGAPADDDSGHPSISADGRFVSFHSFATNLSPNDDKRLTDVFIRDRQASTTQLVSVVPGVPQSEDAAGDSFADSISGDGRYVTFNSSAPGLDLGGTTMNQFDEVVADIFVRDTKTNTTTLVSRATGPAGAPGNDFSSSSVVSGDGRFVAYSSVATNLDPDAVKVDATSEEGEPVSNVYARDVLGPQTVPNPHPGGGPPGCPVRGRLIAGTAKADVRHGGSGSDVMFGLAGGDTLRGGRGRDCLYGGLGRDRLYGQTSADWLFGGPGADRLDGGHGNDRLRGQDGADRLRAGPGRDRLVGGNGSDSLDGAAGDDHLKGSEGHDRLDGGPGADWLSGGSGNDQLSGGSGADELGDHTGRDDFSGGAGNDHIDARDHSRHDRSRGDTVSCGAGTHDVALADVADHVAADCERVVQR